MADDTAENKEKDSPAEETPKRDFSKDPNAQKRMNAGKRSNQRNAGKPIDSEEKPAEEKPAEPKAEESTEESAPAPVANKTTLPEAEIATSEEPAMSVQNPVPAEQDKDSLESDIQGFEKGGEVKDGEMPAAGIMAPDAESPAPDAPAPDAEAPTPEAAPGNSEGGGIVEAATHEKQEILESPADEAKESPAMQQQEMAKGQEMHTPKGADIGEYMPPEGDAHDDLIDAYHDAIMYGNTEEAKQIYRILQNHRFAENAHRTKVEGKAVQDENDYLAAAEELAAKHPELGEDGLPAQKVLALMDIYRNNGSGPADALRQAVADLYPDSANAPMGAPGEQPAPSPEGETAEPAPQESAPEAAAPEAAPEEPAPEEPASEDVEVPDMEDRNVKKREIPSTPASASAKEMPPEPPKTPNRSDAITEMKRKRGQA